MLSQHLKKLEFKNYITADYSSDHVEINLDITKMNVESNFFDFFICGHVLEHVDNDHLALQELYRITKPGGFGILMAPIMLSLPSSIEGISSLSKEERWKYFGQDDHLRLYAHDDYINLIIKYGFKVQQISKKI